jgi:hypothetical protein
MMMGMEHWDDVEREKRSGESGTGEVAAERQWTRTESGAKREP